MSSSSSAPPPQHRYYCHQCACTVPIPPPASLDDDVFCPLCAGGFVELLEEDDPPTNPSPHPQPQPHSPFFPLSSLLDLRHPSDLASFLGPPSPSQSPSAPRAAASAAAPFDATDFLHGHLGGILSGGASIQIIIEGSPFPAGALFGGAGAGGLNLGDYFMGTGLEQLIQQLAENDPNRYGTPPAAKAAVAALPDVTVSQAMMDAAEGGAAQCAVCMDDFELGAAAKQLPCNHVFHKDCILPWLDLHSSCPVCRHELPTDDPDYDSHQRQAAASAGVAPAAAPASPGGASSPRVVERRFRISLPWPFRAAFGGAHTETSDQDADGSGDSSTDARRSYEDLD